MMEVCKDHFKNKYAIYMYGILLISSVLPALLAVTNLKVSPDSMVYALISQEILSGHGIKIPIIYDLRDNFLFINGAVPYLGEPPFLPILFALLGGVTPQSLLPAQIINVISLAAITIFTFMLMKKLYNNGHIALLTGVLVSISYPMLWNANRVLTESLFIALTTAMLFFLIVSRSSDSSKSLGYFLIASICSTAAILTRFAGVGLLPAFFWVTFVLARNNRIRLRNISAIFAITLPLITSAALFVYTYIISGSIHGWKPPATGRSYFDAFLVTIRMLPAQFQLGERPIPLIAIFIVLFLLYVSINDDGRRELQKYIHSGLDLIIIFAISYIAVIMYGMAESQTVIELRYMSPLVPFIFILCMIVLVVIFEILRRKGFTRLSLCGLMLSLFIITFGDVYKTYVNSPELFTKNEGHYRILNSPTYKWIKENYGKNVIITSNRPYHLSFFGGYSTIRLPHRRFEKNTWVPDRMEQILPDRMSKFGSRVLALFDEVDEQHEGSYLANLFRIRKDDKNFILIHDFSDGVVYELNE
jgi:4-amino-4-deoxy-L-arabinose transferase-like glycosyltransferase